MVCFIVSKFNYKGGVERVAHYLYDLCKKRDMTFLIYKTYKVSKDSKHEIGIKTPKLPILDDIIYNIKYYSLIKKLSKNYKNIKLIANAEEGIGSYLLKKENPKIDYIYISHGTYKSVSKTKKSILYKIYAMIKAYFEKISIKNADTIIAVSNLVKEDLVKYYRVNKRIIVVHNPLTSKFKKINKELAKKRLGVSNKKIIIFIGADVIRKGITIFIEVLKKLPDNNIGIIVTKDVKVIKKLIKKHNLEKKIMLLTNISDEKLNLIYSAADALLFPSKYDPYPLTPIEAVYSGTIPIISSKTGEAEVIPSEIAKYIISKEYNIDTYLTKTRRIINLDNKEYKRILLILEKKFKSISKEALKKYSKILFQS